MTIIAGLHHAPGVGRGGELVQDRLSGLLIPFEEDDGCEAFLKLETQLNPKPIRKGCVY